MTEPSDLHGSVVITRDGLLDGSFMEKVRLLTHVPLQTERELASSLAEILSERDAGQAIWIFGYGSLMWNPAFEFAEKRTGTVNGLSRKFCVWTPYGRGTPEKPALTMALDIGDEVTGIAFRFADDSDEAEVKLVWRREMFSSLYVATWVDVETSEGTIRAIAFVADRSQPSYAGTLGEDEVVANLASSVGELGTMSEYLTRTIDHLEEVGIREERLVRLRASLERQRAAQ